MNKLLTIIKLLVPVASILAGFIIGTVWERRVLAKLHAIANKNGWQSYEIFFKSIRGLTLLWCIIAGIFGATLSFPINPGLLVTIHKTLLATLLGSATIVVARLSVKFIELYYSNTVEGASPLTSLLENLTKIAIYSIGFLIILQSIGVGITPLLTALGVGGVSIGLALQNTLSNLFSGLNIITSKKVRPGDYIQLETGEEGYVIDVAWRYTIVREIPDNLIVIPNSKIVSSTFKNYSFPDREMLLLIDLGISYDSDLEKVEAVTLEVARKIMKEVAGGVPEYEPFLRYEQFGYFSINCTVYLRVKEYFDHLLVRHEFIKRLHKRYQIEGIKIPFPIKTVYLPGDGENTRFKLSYRKNGKE